MFTPPLDALLMLMVATPAVGWVAYKKGYRKVPGIYASASLLVAAYFLYGLYKEVEVAENGIVTRAFDIPLGACLEIDFFSVFMAFLYIIIGLFATVYSIKFMERDSGLTEYYTLMLGMIAGMTGIVFAGDFFTLFVFWELMCLTSYALVAFRKQKWEPIEAGFKYLIMSAAGSATILLAMSFLYGMTGTLNFAALADGLTAATSEGWLYITLALVIVGFGVKAAIVPFHTWLPDAHSAAPSPISAMLSGVMVQTGACALVRVLLLVFNSAQPAWQMTLAVFAVFTMFGGNLMALLQDDLKRLLAFSTIANLGYIIFGFATVSHDGLTASLFHITNHAIMKTLLFLCAGAFIRQTKTRDLRKLRGIGKIMPVTGVFFAIGTIAIAAFPPLNGFWSEMMIIAAGVRAEMIIFSTLTLANMALSVVYYFRLIRIIILEEPTKVSKRATKAPVSMLIPLLILAFLCVFIGVYPGPFIGASSKAAEALLNIEAYADAVLGGL
ncbi:MAG: proton-conducting transporter membrane subunit [Candidatus Bathyarchaeota archaeon]|nr:proton-conducting transporter membrane subunit [Candidatus Bathyarchaeota archaeon]MDH5747132.1 proton-conducting transporter membrane subunit [Candidatus Bathyarchaeota archaeon]